MPFRHQISGLLLKTGQTTSYHHGDDGGYRTGLPKYYEVYTTGVFAGTTPVDNPEYAAATVSFTIAGNIIADAALGLATFKTGDTVRIRGSASNDGVYTVAVGNVAAQIVTTEAIPANEGAGRYVTICKRATPSKNVVYDNNTGLYWRRYTTGGPVEKVGPTSVGTLVWYDVAKCYTLHPGAADLQMIASPPTLRIVGGAGEVARYFVGMCLDLTGFVNAVNNLPGLVVTAVTVNGGDLDLALRLPPFSGPLIAEAAAGVRSITIVCQSVFSYVAAMNAAGLGGYSDWRVPGRFALLSIMTHEAPNAFPDAVAFPSWPAAAIEYASATTDPTGTAWELRAFFTSSSAGSIQKTVATYLAFCRGGG